jgi:FkbM family methyltransferase
MYEQDTDVRLLTALLDRLPSKVAIDVGAERGSFTQALLEHGAESVFAVEPYPPNIAALHERFDAEPRVKILEIAVGETGGSATLHLIEDRKGENASSYHSLARASESALLHTVGELTVAVRPLGSLVEDGTLPERVGILKIDAEGHDFAILRGMGGLFAGVVMVEFWDDLPDGVGRRMFALPDVDAFMKARGYAHCAVVKRHDEFETIALDDVQTRPGDWGNAIFLHESVYPQLPVEVTEAAAAAHSKLIDKALFFRSECDKRLAVIEEQSRAIQALRSALDNPVPTAG